MKHAGIWIPIEVLQNSDLTHTERYLLMEIINLDKLKNGCFANNEYFAELLNTSKTNISRSLHSLEKKGYIIIKITPGSRNHKRVIKMIFKGYQNVNKGLSKCEETIDNKSINKSNNIYDDFILAVKKRVKLKSKVTSTKQGRELFKSIDDKNQLLEDYVEHHKEKGEFAKRLTAFMEDYDAFSEDEAMNELVSRYAR